MKTMSGLLYSDLRLALRRSEIFLGETHFLVLVLVFVFATPGVSFLFVVYTEVILRGSECWHDGAHGILFFFFFCVTATSPIWHWLCCWQVTHSQSTYPFVIAHAPLILRPARQESSSHRVRQLLKFVGDSRMVVISNSLGDLAIDIGKSCGNLDMPLWSAVH